MTWRFLTCALLALGAVAQTPRFNVVSVKECHDGEPTPPSYSSPQTLSLSCRPLWRLIAEAYDTYASGALDPRKPPAPLQIQGTPAWADTARYTIDAKSDTPQTTAMMRGPMMQRILEERFQVKVHRETKEVEGWLMTVAKSGLKLHPASDGGCTRVDLSDPSLGPKDVAGKTLCMSFDVRKKGALLVVDARAMPLDVFARFFHPDNKPVFDRTGLTGTFDIHLEYEPDPVRPPAAADGAAGDPTPFTTDLVAIRDQLGLQLVPGKAPYERLILDHVARPSGN
jgi:uncharacterized protein (TIGR03435 family)